MSRRSRRAWCLSLGLALASLCIPTPSPAQFGGMGGMEGLPSFNGIQVLSDESGSIKEPTPFRVYQRDINGRADIPIVLGEKVKDGKILWAGLRPVPNQGPAAAAPDVKFADGKIVGLPTGGPYYVLCTVSSKESFRNAPNQERHFNVGPIFVGDLWVLAGQSNMQGVGDLVDVTPPDPRVMALGMDGKWVRAEEPLHWLVDSPDPVHSGDPATREARSAEEHRTRTKGAGLGLPFAEAMVQATGVPVGLVIAAHGGTSMAQWDPAKKGEGGNSLYGSMLRQVALAGGKVKGLLWYQGESDAIGGAADAYPKVFADFIAAVRSDFGQPELPFYLVQIGRFVNPSDPKGWNAVQEAQRLIPDRVPNTAVVSVIDLELDDAIHVGTQGLKRAGARLARIAQRELFGQLGATTPTFDRVVKGANNTLVVRFKGVNLASDGGFGMGGMGGGMNPARAGGMMQVGISAFSGPQFGLRPVRHIGGFSIRDANGAALPLIFEAAVGKARDTVVLKLAGPVPEKASLWYGHGLDPYCNLTDGLDMAVPVFGPISLDDVR